MTLKTLKEIFDIKDHEDEVYMNILKKEAINWIKNYTEEHIYEKDIFGKIKRECFRKDIYDREDIMCELFKRFFNITEEDLK